MIPYKEITDPPPAIMRETKNLGSLISEIVEYVGTAGVFPNKKVLELKNLVSTKKTYCVDKKITALWKGGRR